MGDKVQSQAHHITKKSQIVAAIKMHSQGHSVPQACRDLTDLTREIGNEETGTYAEKGCMLG